MDAGKWPLLPVKGRILMKVTELNKKKLTKITNMCIM